MEKCEEGLKRIEEILHKKADSMLEDGFYDLSAEVAVLSQIHPWANLNINKAQ